METAKNGLPQGGLLAPTLFNIHTNDQSLLSPSNAFLYADDLALAVTANTFQDVEPQLETCLVEFSKFYKEDQLKANPSKTEFLTLSNGDEKAHLVPVLNTILKLSPEETQKLQSVARGGEGLGWSSFLPIWSNHQ